MRLQELQAAVSAKDTKAVIAARGGYGTTRILDQLDLAPLEQSPKWIVGSSDLTALLLTLYIRHGIVSIHGPMAFKYAEADPEDTKALIRLLETGDWSPPGDLEPLSKGTAKGPLIGGNLTMLAHLAGTIPQDTTNGAILFMEDVTEQPYRLDRCLTQLKRAHLLDHVAGIVLGTFHNCTPGPDKTTAQAVLEQNLKPLGIPMAKNYPAAHGPRNYPFPHGAEITLEVTADQATIGLDW